MRLFEEDLVGSLDNDTTVECPHCGEPLDISLHPGARRQRLTEECAQCARSVEVRVEMAEGGVLIDAYPA